MTRLYLDIDGVLLTTKQTQAAEGVASFIHFIMEHFDCYWLTTHCRGDSKTSIKYLSQYLGAEEIENLKDVQATNWLTLKTEAIDLNSDFYWLEDYPLQAELNILEAHDKADRLIKVSLNDDDELERVKKMLRDTSRKTLLK